MVRRAPRLTAVLVVILASGCSAGSGQKSADHQAVQVVEGYVHAMATGDIDRAMTYRCPKFQTPAADRPDLADQLRRFTAAAGPIGRVKAYAPVRTGLKPVEQLPNPIEVGYNVFVGGQMSTALIAVTVSNHGHRQLCGLATLRARFVLAEARERLNAGPATLLAPHELLPRQPPPGQLVVDQDAMSDERRSGGAVSAWTRVWQTGTYGGTRITAVRYTTEEQALAAVRSRLDDDFGGMVERFDIPGVSHAIGLRVVGYGTLGVQPPNLGPYLDDVVAVYGTTAVRVAPANLPTGSDHALAISLMQDLDARARG